MDSAGEPAAWAVLQTPFWTIDMAADPDGPPDLLRQVLDWADQRARQALDGPYGRPCWFVMAFDHDRELAGVLAQAGFADQFAVSDAAPGSDHSWSKVWMERPAALPVATYRLPAGFRVRPLAGEAEVAAYVALHQETFGSKNMTAAWRRRTLAQPAYDPALDVVVESPDGRLGAFCIGWLERTAAGLRGQIEPLGCHPDFRRYALGRLALAEVLRRLQAGGAETVYLETDNYRDTARSLYEALGFRVACDVHVWRKDYA